MVKDIALTVYANIDCFVVYINVKGIVPCHMWYSIHINLICNQKGFKMENIENMLEQVLKQNAFLAEQNRQLSELIIDIKDDIYPLKAEISSLIEEIYILRGVIQQLGGER